MTELKNITTTPDNKGVYQGIFQLRSVPVLSDVVVTFLSSIIILTPNGNFWVVPLLHSLSDLSRIICI